MKSDTIGVITIMFFLFICIVCVCAFIICHTTTPVHPELTPIPLGIIPEDIPTPIINRDNML